MGLPDTKALKKLVATCRKLGIKTFKSSEFEFTLDDYVKLPIKASKSKAQSVQDEVIESDELSLEQLLAWNDNTVFDEPQPKDPQGKA